jgi:hypothetical protein
MPGLSDILTVILGGGRGTRLWPLTQQRSKPAVPIAGKYRLIDIPISNSINSGIYRIAVLTQYNSVSLHRHISHTYHFDAFHLAGCNCGRQNKPWKLPIGTRARQMRCASSSWKLLRPGQATC